MYDIVKQCQCININNKKNQFCIKKQQQTFNGIYKCFIWRRFRENTDYIRQKTSQSGTKKSSWDQLWAEVMLLSLRNCHRNHRPCKLSSHFDLVFSPSVFCCFEGYSGRELNIRRKVESKEGRKMERKKDRKSCQFVSCPIWIWIQIQKLIRIFGMTKKKKNRHQHRLF